MFLPQPQNLYFKNINLWNKSRREVIWKGEDTRVIGKKKPGKWGSPEKVHNVEAWKCPGNSALFCITNAYLKEDRGQRKDIKLA